MRKSTLILSNNLDDPNYVIEAGSNEEFDLLCEWNRTELVEVIQALSDLHYFSNLARRNIILRLEEILKNVDDDGMGGYITDELSNIVDEHGGE